jgi:outer membrane protein assembly factor BamB
VLAAGAALALATILAAYLVMRVRAPDVPDGWPSFRGPSGDGRIAALEPVTKWSRTENVLWKVPVSGKGYSSPVVCDSRVFLTTSDPFTFQQRVLAYDRESGKLLFDTLVHKAEFMRSSPENSHASSTPACDKERVYAAFIGGGALWLSALDFAGRIAWQSNLGAFVSEHGYGSSLALHRSLVIALGDGVAKGFVAGVDRRTGKTVWRSERKASGWKGSYGSPVIARVAGRTQLLVVGLDRVSSYDPDTGELSWFVKGPAESTVASPAFSDDLVFGSGGDPKTEILAIRADGKGDVTGSHVAWRSRRGVSYVPSPVFHEGKLIVVNDEGIVNCFDAVSGKSLWQARLEGPVLASPVVAAGLVFATNDAGKTFVFKAASQFELVAENDVAKRVRASPAIDRGRLYLRTEDELFCIGRADAPLQP